MACRIFEERVCFGFSLLEMQVSHHDYKLFKRDLAIAEGVHLRNDLIHGLVGQRGLSTELQDVANLSSRDDAAARLVKHAECRL